MSYDTNDSSPTSIKVIEIDKRGTNEIHQQATLYKADIVFIIATLGEDSTTKSATVIAKSAKKQNKLTVGITKLPFTFEGRKKKRIAHHGMMQLKNTVDLLIVIPNDHLLKEEDVNVKIVQFMKELQKLRQQQLQRLSQSFTNAGPIVHMISDIETLHINFISEQYNHRAIISS